MDTGETRPLMISRGWIQAAVVVLNVRIFHPWCAYLLYLTTNLPNRMSLEHERVDLAYPRGYYSGPADLSRQRPDGVWLDIWPWCVSRAGFRSPADKQCEMNLHSTGGPNPLCLALAKSKHSNATNYGYQAVPTPRFCSAYEGKFIRWSKS